MVINSIQVGMKQSKVDLLALLTAPVEQLAESTLAVSMVQNKPEIATTLNSSRSRWQRLDALIIILRKESPVCN